MSSPLGGDFFLTHTVQEHRIRPDILCFFRIRPDANILGSGKIQIQPDPNSVERNV